MKAVLALLLLANITVTARAAEFHIAKKSSGATRRGADSG